MRVNRDHLYANGRFIDAVHVEFDRIVGQATPNEIWDHVTQLRVPGTVKDNSLVLDSCYGEPHLPAEEMMRLSGIANNDASERTSTGDYSAHSRL
jgi:hypothetical protein